MIGMWLLRAVLAMSVWALTTQATDQDPFYEVLHSWPGNFKGNFCITAPQDLYGWKLKLKFRAPVTSLQIYDAEVFKKNSLSTVYKMKDKGYNGRWLEGERICFEFIGSGQDLTDGVKGKPAFIALPVEVECPDQIQGQLFTLDIRSEWQNGISGQFCLRTPRDMDGWQVRFEVDRKGITSLQISNADLEEVVKRLTWMMTPKNYNRELKEGDPFCVDFVAQTRGWVKPCIRAFFTEDDGVTPIEVPLPPTTQAPPTQPPTTETPTTQPPETEAPPTQPPETEAPPTQPPETEAPPTQPPETEAPPTQPPETEAPPTQPPETETPPTQPPETEAPPTQPPETEAPPTQPPETEAPPTQPPETEAPPTQPPETEAPPTQPPETEAPPTQPPETEAPPTQPPETEAPPTQPPTTEAPRTQGPKTEAPPTSNSRYDYGQALNDSLLFYMAQRSGALPDNHVPWRKDSALGDGVQVGGVFRDLTGGWYDAGDYLKLNFPMAASTTNLLWGLLAFEDGYEASEQLQRMRDVIRWPLDYFLKCWDAGSQILYGQVGNVFLDHSYWGRPEDMEMDRPVYELTTSKPGSDLAGETAAAFAAGYLAFKDIDASYADDLLQAARSLYDFADNYRGYYHNSITDAGSVYRSYGFQDELCWGAAWLFRATGQAGYKAKAEQAYAASNAANSGEFSWDDKGIGCAVLLHGMETDSNKKEQYASAINAFTRKWRTGSGPTITPCGLSWLRKWGALRYALNAAMISMMAAEEGLEVEENREWALSQMNYALGDNKHGRSYVVGFGVNPPVQPHHASSSCPLEPATCDWGTFHSSDPNAHVLYGALVGGPDNNDDYTDKRQDYVMNEVACDYNAGFQTVLAALVSLEAQSELPDARPTCPQPRGGTTAAPPPQGSTRTPAPPGTSGPTVPPVDTGNKNQEMLDLYTNTYQGDGTYYGEGRSGTCTYDPNNFPAVGLSPQIDALAALNQIKFYNSKACGMCFKVTGNGNGAGNDPIVGEHIVFVKDLCPNGACSHPGSVDFAQNGDGRWDIEIQAVQCPVGNNKLQYAFQGSNPWYIKLQVSNYRLPPNDVSIQRNGVWLTLGKTDDGYWVVNDGVEMTNTNDIPVRVTAINGEQVTDTIPRLDNSVVMDGKLGVQFSLDPTLPAL